MYYGLEDYNDEVGALLQDHYDINGAELQTLLDTLEVEVIIVEDYNEFWAEGLGFDAVSTFERVVQRVS